MSDLAQFRPDPRPEPSAGGIGRPKRGSALAAPRRIRDAIREAKCQECRLCGNRHLVQAHHLIPRGMGGTIGGEWTHDNIVGLDLDCHQLVEARDADACRVLRSLLTDAELAYILKLKGPAWLDRRYPPLGAAA